MRVIVLDNPSAGRGVAKATADAIAHDLQSRRHEVVRAQAPPKTASPDDLVPILTGADALIVAGGDGATRRAARSALIAGVPLYQAPCGTQSLLAREFSMRADPQSVAAAIDAQSITEIDAPRCNGELFLLMCGVGADAAIVHRLSRSRTGPISRGAYVPHIVAEALTAAQPRLTVRAGGEELISARRGAIIIANCRQYALGANPAPEASMNDQLLDLVFLPSSLAIGSLAWSVMACAGWHRSRAARRLGVFTTRAASFDVTCDPQAPFQIDGDPLPYGSSTGNLRRIAIDDQRLRILLPAKLSH